MCGEGVKLLEIACILLLKGFISVMALMVLMAGHLFVQFCVWSLGKVVFR